MDLLFFSVVTSIICFNVFVLIVILLRSNTTFITSFNINSILFIMMLSIFRIFISPNINRAFIIRSESIYPWIFDFIRKEYSIFNITIHIYDILGTIWIFGILIGFMRLINNYNQLKNLKVNNVINKNKENLVVLNEVLSELNLESNINVIQSNEIVFPMIIGNTSATIYLPDIKFNEKQLRYLFLHEINHFLGKDQIKKFLVQIIKIIFWWNPFVYLFVKEYNHILEIQCDLRATENMDKKEKKIYLDNIILVLKHSKDIKYKKQPKYVPSLISNSRVKEIKKRFQIILNYKKKRYSTFVNILICICFFIITLSSYFLVVQPAYYPEEQDIYESMNLCLEDEV